MSDQEKIEVLLQALSDCYALFTRIRNDWSDPRYQVRSGWATIELATKKTGLELRPSEYDEQEDS